MNIKSIIDEIIRIRGSDSISIDRRNQNRYRVVVHETDLSQSAYYFSSPIYNRNRSLIDLKFILSPKNVSLIGSNAEILLYDNAILLSNDEGELTLTMPHSMESITENIASYGDFRACPTTNGVAISSRLNNEKKFVFEMELPSEYTEIRSNGKYLAIMKDKLKPIAVISAIGALNANGAVQGPVQIEHQSISSRRMAISISPFDPSVENVFFEVNLHEKKLLMDTTVESKTPTRNNAFGGVAFIGNSNEFGEQWLYARTEAQLLSDLFYSYIFEANIYYPCLNNSKTALTSYVPERRFCSIGTNWTNKKNGNVFISDSEIIFGYQRFNVSNTLVQDNKLFAFSEGMIIRNKYDSDGYSVISTGDSCYAPPILEIRYK